MLRLIKFSGPRFFFGIGCIADLAVFWYGLATLVYLAVVTHKVLFSARSYYESAQTLYHKINIHSISSVCTFNDLLHILKKHHNKWNSLLLSDCYVIKVYHFLKQNIRDLITTMDYLNTTLTKRDCDFDLYIAANRLKTKVESLRKTFERLCALCEHHELFNTHLKIYYEQERLKLKRERMLQKALDEQYVLMRFAT